MKVVRDMTKKIRSRGRMFAENRRCVAELLQTVRKRGSIQEKKKPCKHGMFCWRN